MILQVQLTFQHKNIVERLFMNQNGLMNDDLISTPALFPDSPKSIAQDGQEEILVQREEMASTTKQTMN
jgi:hypothetical protein